MALSNKPTVGGDNNTWGQELNDALDELNNTKVENGTVYLKAETDARYLRTVNGNGPDADGNVTVDVQAGTTDQTARDAAAAAQADVDSLIALQGVAGGTATLDPSGQLDATQALNLAPVVQNNDGTWPARPVTAAPVTWVMIVASSAAPDGNGTIGGGAGMVPLLDVLRDHTSTLGA